MMRLILLTLATTLLTSAAPAPHPWPAPAAPVVPQADGFVVIPGAVLAPQKSHQYRAVFDATHAADHPNELLPAINMAGSELNALGTLGGPVTNAHFVLVFHGAALDGILDGPHYRKKFGVANPNLPALAAMRKAGVELYVCGQNLAFAGIDPATLTPDVKVASDALLVLMHFQQDGYALMSF